MGKIFKPKRWAGGPSTSNGFESSQRTPVLTMNQQVVAHHQKKIIIFPSSSQVNTQGGKWKRKSEGTQTLHFFRLHKLPTSHI